VINNNRLTSNGTLVIVPVLKRHIAAEKHHSTERSYKDPIRYCLIKNRSRPLLGESIGRSEQASPPSACDSLGGVPSNGVAPRASSTPPYTARCSVTACNYPTRILAVPHGVSQDLSPVNWIRFSYPQLGGLRRTQCPGNPP